MGLTKWIPWQLIARKAAKAYGFNDPVETLSRIRRFSKPSETNEPIELLRAGFAFHARGLANTKAIQNNLDWIWPYWIERQYDPTDDSFIPRAFSFSHINLTHRNWTATSAPGSDSYVVVDPRGLVTPFHDSWSIDFWIVTKSGRWLIPSKLKSGQQRLENSNTLNIVTRSQQDNLSLETKVSVQRDKAGAETGLIELEAECDEPAHLAIAVRPYNPEGIQFIDTISVDSSKQRLTINGEATLQLPASVERYVLSNYETGDVAHELNSPTNDSTHIECEAGMATAVALIPLDPRKTHRCEIRVPLGTDSKAGTQQAGFLDWNSALSHTTKLSVPDERENRQFLQSLTALAQLSASEIFPGPYTYRRFWFRDACLIANALLKTNQIDPCRRALDTFPDRQTKDGYFLSQEGEWDSNGQVLWFYDRFESLTGEPLPDRCLDTISPALKWLGNKLLDRPGHPTHGLLPAGFSAEHFGPNDHYYWDDFWAVSGIQAAARILDRHGEKEAAELARRQADALLKRIEDSLQNLASKRAKGLMPASPFRRMDAGAIGSLVTDYPLQLFPKDDPRVLGTANFLFEHCLVDDAFFQDMIHSGLNIYLTIDLAQTFLRAGDPRWMPLIESCLQLASPTGQWPEAIHPKTKGGCMGDGQHAWAAAEWLNFAIDRIVREEGDHLVIGSGVTNSWIQSGSPISVQNTPTKFGIVSVSIQPLMEDAIEVSVKILPHSYSTTPVIEYSVPHYEKSQGRGLTEVTLYPSESNAHVR